MVVVATKAYDEKTCYQRHSPWERLICFEIHSRKRKKLIVSVCIAMIVVSTFPYLTIKEKKNLKKNHSLQNCVFQYGEINN